MTLQALACGPQREQRLLMLSAHTSGTWQGHVFLPGTIEYREAIVSMLTSSWHQETWTAHLLGLAVQ